MTLNASFSGAQSGSALIKINPPHRPSFTSRNPPLAGVTSVKSQWLGVCASTCRRLPFPAMVGAAYRRPGIRLHAQRGASVYARAVESLELVGLRTNNKRTRAPRRRGGAIPDFRNVLLAAGEQPLLSPELVDLRRSCRPDRNTADSPPACSAENMFHEPASSRFPTSRAPRVFR